MNSYIHEEQIGTEKNAIAFLMAFTCVFAGLGTYIIYCILTESDLSFNVILFLLGALVGFIIFRGLFAIRNWYENTRKFFFYLTIVSNIFFIFGAIALMEISAVHLGIETIIIILIPLLILQHGWIWIFWRDVLHRGSFWKWIYNRIVVKIALSNIKKRYPRMENDETPSEGMGKIIHQDNIYLSQKDKEQAKKQIKVTIIGIKTFLFIALAIISLYFSIFWETCFIVTLIISFIKMFGESKMISAQAQLDPIMRDKKKALNIPNILILFLLLSMVVAFFKDGISVNEMRILGILAFIYQMIYLAIKLIFKLKIVNR